MEFARPEFLELGSSGPAYGALPPPGPLSLQTGPLSLQTGPLSLQIGIARRPSDLLGAPLDSLALTLATFPEVDAGHDRRVVSVPDLDEAITVIEKTVLDNPIAAATADSVLRINSQLSIHDGLVVESLAYSTLQAGPEFAAWLATRPSARLGLERDPVRLHRTGDDFRITLDRPEKHNALNRAMRDALLTALEIVVSCPELQVTLSGNGPSFCSGGDLDEFGQFVDPATAHLVRTALSIGAQLAPVSSRVTALVHGFTGGSGLELAAFCGRVVSTPSALFFLPELALGLIPGAGGTVSINRRIGRWRTLWMLLSGTHVLAETALDWGLIDAIDDALE